MNPLVLFKLLGLAGEAIGEAFGRRSQKESKRERFWFGIVYTFVIVAGIGTLVWTIYSLYFAK